MSETQTRLPRDIMADASVSASSGSRCSSAASPKLTTCLCSPTNHPGSFRCSRHRSPRGRPSSSSSSSSSSCCRASQAVQAARAEGVRSSGGVGRGKGRSVLRAHLLRMISPPSSGRAQRRDFQPRPSRLGLVSA